MITCKIGEVKGGGYCVMVRNRHGTILNQPYVIDTKEQAEKRLLFEMKWVNQQNQSGQSGQSEHSEQSR